MFVNDLQSATCFRDVNARMPLIVDQLIQQISDQRFTGNNWRLHDGNFAGCLASHSALSQGGNVGLRSVRSDNRNRELL